MPASEVVGGGARAHATISNIHLFFCFRQQQNRTSRAAEAETFYIRKGANGTLPCLPVAPGDSQATMNKIEWFKEEKKLLEAEARHIIVWNTKNTIAFLPETGALLFRGVTNEDSGEYHCLLTKQASGEIEDGVVRFYVQGEFSWREEKFFFPSLFKFL